MSKHGQLFNEWGGAEKHNDRDVEVYKPWHEDLQVLMEEYWEVWQSTENDIYQNIKSVTKRREQFDKLKAFITSLTEDHQELQKARADWLTSEIEKLEGMKKDPSKGRLSGDMMFLEGLNQALTSIITRYKEELLELDKTTGL